MFGKLCFVLLFAPMALAQPAPSATPPATELRLEDVVREALAANPALARAATLVAAQRAHVCRWECCPIPPSPSHGWAIRCRSRYRTTIPPAIAESP